MLPFGYNWFFFYYGIFNTRWNPGKKPIGNKDPAFEPVLYVKYYIEMEDEDIDLRKSGEIFWEHMLRLEAMIKYCGFASQKAGYE